MLIAGVFLALLAGLLWWAGSGPPPGPPRVTFDVRSLRAPEPGLLAGNRACGECHPGEAAQYARTGHRRTLRDAGSSPLARRLDGRSIADPELPGVTWTYSLRDGRFAVDRVEGGERRRLPIEFAFGSGHHATTFVTLSDPDPARPVAMEHRLTYFAQDGSLHVTPGQSLARPVPGLGPVGLSHSTEETFECFQCHTTVISDRGQGVLDPSTMVPNLSCERCHGPGRPHIEAARRGAGLDELAMLFGPGRWTAQDQIRLCGQCHRDPEEGDPLKVRRDNLEIIRYQPVGLAQSECYRKSQGALSCVTCHDPHARLSTDRAAYEATCLRCHEEPPQATCPVSPLDGCIGCHMPRRDSGQSILFTDHWIAINPGLGPRADRAKPASDPPVERQP